MRTTFREGASAPGVVPLKVSSNPLDVSPKTTVLPAKTRPIAAPRKFAPWMIGVAEQVVKQGRPLKYVADTLGISLGTLDRWRAFGVDERCADLDLQAFATVILKARAEVVGDLVEVMRAHANNDWRAAHTLLKALDPDVWVETTKSKSDVTVVAAAPADLSCLTDDELEMKDRIEAKLTARAALPAS